MMEDSESYRHTGWLHSAWGTWMIHRSPSFQERLALSMSGDNTWSQRSGHSAGASALVECGLESSGSVVVAHGIVLAVCGLLVGLATSQCVGS